MYIWLVTLIGPLLLTVLLKMPQVCGLAFNLPLAEYPHCDRPGVGGDSISSRFWLSEKALLFYFVIIFLLSWFG